MWLGLYKTLSCVFLVSTPFIVASIFIPSYCLNVDFSDGTAALARFWHGVQSGTASSALVCPNPTDPKK